MDTAFGIRQGEPGLVPVVALAEPDIALHHLEAVLHPVVQFPHQEAVVVERGLQAPLPHFLFVDHDVEGFGDAADVARHVVGHGGACAFC